MYWIQTYTGKMFRFLNPTEDSIDIFDIAHHLSMLCRFSGAVEKFYSVAEHSVRVSDVALASSIPASTAKENAMCGLLHDAAEAYVNDLTRPLKDLLEENENQLYSQIEDKISNVIFKKYNIDGFYKSDVIKHYDLVLRATEKRDLLLYRCDEEWEQLPDPLPDIIVPMTQEKAELEFLKRFMRLFKGDER